MKLIRTLTKLIRTPPKLIRTLTKLIHTLTKLIHTLTKLIRTLTKLIRRTRIDDLFGRYDRSGTRQGTEASGEGYDGCMFTGRALNLIA